MEMSTEYYGGNDPEYANVGPFTRGVEQDDMLAKLQELADREGWEA